MDFQTPKFWEFALFNNHYQISKLPGSYRNWLIRNTTDACKKRILKDRLKL